MESATSLQSLSRLDSSPSIFSYAASDLMTSPRGFTWIGSVILISGLSCSGSVSFLLAVDTTSFGFLIPLRSFAHAGPASLLSGYVTMEPLLFMRSLAQLDLSTFPLGMGRLGPAPFVLDSNTSDLFFSIRSLAHADFSLLMSDVSGMGLFLFIRSFSHLSSSVPPIGLARIGSVFMLLVIDSIHMGLLSLVKSFLYAGSALLALDFLHLDLLLSPRDFTHPGSTFSCFGLGRVGLVFSLLVTSTASVELTMFTRSLAQMDLLVSSLGFSDLGLFTFLKSLAQPDPFFFFFGMARMNSSSPAYDTAWIELTLSLQSLGCSESVSFPFNCASLELLMLPRNCIRLESMVSTFGLSCIGFVSSLSVLQGCSMDLSLSLRSFSRSEFVLSTLDSLHLGSLLFLRTTACFDFPLSLVGLVCADSISFVFVVDTVNIASTFFARSFGYLELATFVLDSLHPGSSTLVRSFARLDFPILLIQSIRMGSPLPSFDFTQFEPNSLTQSLGWTDSMFFCLNVAHVDFLLSLQSFSCLTFTPSVSGISHLGFVSSPLMIDVASVDLPPSVHSFGRLGLSTPSVGLAHLGPFLSPHSLGHLSLSASPSNLVHLGFSASLQKLAQPGLTLSFFGSTVMGLSISVFDFGCLASMVFVHGLARLALLLSLFDLSAMDLFLPLQQFVHLGISLSVSGLNRIDSIFPLPVVDHAHCEPALSLRSSSCCGFLLLMSDVGRFGFPLPLQSVARSELCLFTFSVCVFDYAQSMSIVNFETMGLTLPVRSLT